MAEDKQKKLVLVVDDEEDVIAYLTALLADNGFATDAARDGKEAMDKIKQNRPALVSLDMSMPEKSGVKVFREIKESEELKGIPVLVVTGVTGYGDKPEEFEKFLSTRKNLPPPDGFIAKPLDQEKFIAKVRELIEKK